MSITTCPTDIVGAPAERVWDLLTQPEKLAEWSGVKLINGPTRPLEIGDRLVLGPGFGLRIIFEVLGMESPSQLTVDVRLPFGVINHEVIQVSSVEPGRCRVTYN